MYTCTKCEFIRVSYKKHLRTCDYYIQDHSIKAVTHVKYLSVTNDKHLSFNEQVNRIAHKANTFLQRNIKSYPLQVKENCYKIMVRPIVEYTCTCSLVTLYRKVIRTFKYLKQYKKDHQVVNNDYSSFSSVTAMMQDLEWPALEERRWATKVTVV